VLEIQVLGWNRPKIVAGLNWFMGSQLSPSDSWIFYDNTYINKCTYAYTMFARIFHLYKLLLQKAR
jgi:hypothetical protein